MDVRGLGAPPSKRPCMALAPGERASVSAIDGSWASITVTR